MIRINVRKPGLSIFAVFLASTVLFAAVLINTNYKIFIGLLAGGGGKGTSKSYKIASGVIGQGIIGNAGSASYQIGAGYISRAEVLKAQAATDLSGVYVYPNPYKPNSPGSRFYADRITFKKLTVEATIKVWTITGELAATLEKTDAFDDYEWSATNDAGQKLASGVYIYLITTPDGEKARGKFSIIK